MQNLKKQTGGFPWVPVVAVVAIAILLGKVAMSGRGFDRERFLNSFRAIDAGWISLAILFILLSYLGRAIRWQEMMRALGPKSGVGRTLVGTVIGFTAVVVLGRAGEFVRPWMIGRDSKTSFSSQLAIWLLERIYDLLVVICFFGFGLIHLADSPRLGSAQRELRVAIESGGVAALVGGVVCLGFLLGLRFLGAEGQATALRLVDRLPRVARVRLKPVAESFLEGALASCSPRSQGLVLLYTVIEWAIIASCFYCIFRSFGPTQGFTMADAVAVNGLVAFGSIVQLPGIGGGMQVAAIAVLTQLFGLGFEEATSLSVLLWGISFVLIVPVGILLGIREGVSWRRIQELEKEAV